MYWNSSSREVLGDGSCLHLGLFVQLYGKLEWKNGEPTIMATRIQLATGAHAELMWWLDVASVHKKVYSTEFKVTVPPETEENLASQSMSQRR